MQGLKALVIFMGVLILVGTTALIVLSVKKFNKLGSDEASPATAEVTELPVPVEPQAPMAVQQAAGWKSFGDVSVALPAGARISSVRDAGNLLIISYSAASNDGVVIFDMAAGRELGKIKLVAGQAGN